MSTSPTDAAPPLRLAVVGAGVIGQHHARVAAQHPDLDLVASSTPSPRRPWPWRTRSPRPACSDP
ncbi:hypothetical protein [Curtobacterium sp. MCBD17_003]|uniref:hypothetical protein n=1 Tax=Curtobacterium sp. MCBD17_003 TaxID=2175667 RepID=UPI0032E7F792